MLQGFRFLPIVKLFYGKMPRFSDRSLPSDRKEPGCIWTLGSEFQEIHVAVIIERNSCSYAFTMPIWMNIELLIYLVPFKQRAIQMDILYVPIRQCHSW